MAVGALHVRASGYQHYFIFILLDTVTLPRISGDACETSPVVSFL